MSRTNLEANTGTLSSDTTSIRREIQGMIRTASLLREAAQEMGRMWDGAAKREFLTNMNQSLDNLDSILAELNRFAGLTDESRMEYERCEAAVGQVLSQLRI
ncbi:MAG: hypothetical protein IJT94_03350 [Oscillibacter sp.]|nr:hypothetical protein [Oscillibacter sp.]